MTRLSVNINKVATLRNARGGNVPDLIQVAIDCQRFGAEGITVHPRPDERHIRYSDLLPLRDIVTTEFNIEGYPDSRYMDIVMQMRPAQATLVPDPPGALTSSAGWDTASHLEFLREIVGSIKKAGIRTSIFVEPSAPMLEGAAAAGADRVELYTEPYATLFPEDPESAVAPYADAALVAKRLGLGLNAGHDLNLHNLRFLIQRLPNLLEVSIGHALISDALYFGLENTIQMYKRQLLP